MISRGVFEFKTKPSDFGRIGGEIRLMAEQGRTHLLPLDTKETMVATNAGYSQELYDISRRVFGPIGSTMWQQDYHLKRAVGVRELTAAFLKDMFDKCKSDDVSMKDYTAVKWWQQGNGYRPDATEFAKYAQYLMTVSERHDVPAWTFLIVDVRSHIRLYVRTAFLESFGTGRDLLNYIYMLEKARNSKTKKPNRRNDRFNAFLVHL